MTVYQSPPERGDIFRILSDTIPGIAFVGTPVTNKYEGRIHVFGSHVARGKPSSSSRREIHQLLTSLTERKTPSSCLVRFDVMRKKRRMGALGGTMGMRMAEIVGGASLCMKHLQDGAEQTGGTKVEPVLDVFTSGASRYNIEQYPE